MNLMNCKNEKERDTFRASETSFDAHKFYSTCLSDKACAIIFPNCLKLLHLMLIFPLSTACVERFFSLLHKTLLICINIFRDNTIIAYVITFSNKILNKLCDLMTNSFQLNTHLFFSEERFIQEAVVRTCSVKKVFIEILQTSQENGSGTGVSCEFCKISKNTFFHRAPLVAVSVFPYCYVAKQFFGIAYFTDILSFEKIFFQMFFSNTV